MTRSFYAGSLALVWLIILSVVSPACAHDSRDVSVLMPGNFPDRPWDLFAACQSLVPERAGTANAPRPREAEAILGNGHARMPRYRVSILFQNVRAFEQGLARLHRLAPVVVRDTGQRYLVVAVPNPVPTEVLRAMRAMAGLQGVQPQCVLPSPPAAIYREGQPQDWWKELIDYGAIHDVQSTRTIVVAVLDKSFNLHQPQIVPYLWRGEDCNGDNVDDDHDGYADNCHGWDFVDNDEDVTGVGTHGTSVLAIVAALGSCDGCSIRIMPLRVDPGSADTVAAALRYAKAHAVHVVNASLDVVQDQVVQTAVAELRGHVLLVAAAGNNSEYDLKAGHIWPAAGGLVEPHVIAVQAVGLTDEFAASLDMEENEVGEFCQSSHASGMRLLAAPGKDIEICDSSGACVPPIGETSAAAPFVSAAAALVLSDARFSSFHTPAAVATLLLDKSRTYLQSEWCTKPQQAFSVLNLSFLRGPTP